MHNFSQNRKQRQMVFLVWLFFFLTGWQTKKCSPLLLFWGHIRTDIGQLVSYSVSFAAAKHLKLGRTQEQHWKALPKWSVIQKSIMSRNHFIIIILFLTDCKSHAISFQCHCLKAIVLIDELEAGNTTRNTLALPGYCNFLEFHFNAVHLKGATKIRSLQAFTSNELTLHCHYSGCHFQNS